MDNSAAEKNNAFGERLKRYRTEAGLLQREVAEIAGVSPVTILNWEKGLREPDYSSIIGLCQALNVTVEQLFEDIPPEYISKNFRVTDEEQKQIQNLRSLPKRDRLLVAKIIDTICETEKRSTEAEQKEQETLEKSRYEKLYSQHILLFRQSTSAAAGLGSMFGDTEATPVFVKVTAENRKADIIVHVEGQSMEPVYPDGCDVYVQYTQYADVGDDVIATTADGAVIKRINPARRLYSVNPKLPFKMKYEDDNVQIIGKVLGIVEKEDMADKKDMPTLRLLFKKDLRKKEESALR